MRCVRSAELLILSVAAVALLLVFCCPANATDSNKWILGASGSWGDSGNWSLGLVPDSTHDALIELIDGNKVITYSSGTSSINSLDSYERIKITGGHLTTNTDSIIRNVLEITGGELTAATIFNIEGLLWTGGTISGSGPLTLTAGHSGAISGASAKYLKQTLNNQGTLTWIGSADVTGYDTTVINNNGLYDLQHAGSIVVLGQVAGHSTATFNNTGIFRKSSGTDISYIDWIFNNASGASVEANTGSIRFRRGGNIQGNFTGAGKSYLENASFNLVGAVNSENLVLDGATLNGSGGSLSGSSFVWNYGTMTGTIDTSGNMEVSGASTKYLNGILSNSGTILWKGSADVTGYDTTVINNNGLYDLQHAGSIVALGQVAGHSTATFNNTGIFRKSSGTDISYVDWIFNNASGASVEANTGSIRFRRGGNIQGNFTGAGKSYLENGTFYLVGALNSENLVLDGATLNGGGGSLSGSLFVWNYGTMTGTIDTSGNMEVSGASTKYLNGILNNSGNILWKGSADVTGYDTTVINNNGLYDIQHAGSIVVLGQVAGHSTAAFNNAGIFRKSSGTDISYVDWIFNNASGASVEANTGSIRFRRGGNIQGNFTGAGKSYLENGSFNLVGALNSENLVLDGATLDGNVGSLSGSLFVWNYGTMTGTINTSGNMEVSGPSTKYLNGILNNSGTILWKGSADVTGYDTTVINNHGHYDLQHAGSIVALGQVAGHSTAAFNNTGIFRKSSGTDNSYIDWNFTNNGTIDAQTGTINLRKGLTNYSGNVLTGGTYLITSTLKVKDADIVTNGGNIVLNGSGSKFVDDANVNALANFATNTGGFTIKNGRDFDTKGALANSGYVGVKNGSTLSVKGNYTQSAGSTQLEDGTIRTTDAAYDVLIDGGVLAGNGTIESDVFSSGEVSPGLSPGTLYINGNYTQQSSGLLTIELATLTDFDKLNITGDANLAGTLSVKMLNTLTVSAGDQFIFLMCSTGTRNGKFDFVNGLSAGPLSVFDVQYDNTYVKLVALTDYSAVPEPSSLVVLFGGVSGLVVFVRRRRS